MIRLSFSPAAAADIDDIWDYTAKRWGIGLAESYFDAIRDTCNALAAGDKRGRAVDVRDGYLRYPVGRHLVFYRQLDAGILVIRILHQSMDVDRHL